MFRNELLSKFEQTISLRHAKDSFIIDYLCINYL